MKRFCSLKFNIKDMNEEKKTYIVRRRVINRADLATLQQCRDFVVEKMENAGYSNEQIKYFLAGATICGYFSESAIPWQRLHAIEKHFTHLDPMDYGIERAGDHPRLRSSHPFTD
jgi:hypothetical protein